MRLNQVIRYIGLLLLVISFLGMLGLYSYSYLGIGQESVNQQNTSVLLVSEGELIPQTELRAIFRSMDLPMNSIQVSEDSDLSHEQTELGNAIQSIRSDKVIIIATQKSVYPSLLLSVTSEKIQGLILLSPDMSVSDDLSIFGARTPLVPTIFLAPDDEYVRTLYERLSGEDAKLFPGIKVNTFLPYEIYSSPDSRRYLSVWSALGTSDISKTLFLFMPGVTEEIGSLIGTHILLDAELASNARNMAQTARSVIFWSAVLLITGLFMFISSVPVRRKRPSVQIPDGLPQVEGTEGAIVPAKEQGDHIPDIFLDDSARLRYKKKTFSIELLFSALCSIIMVVIFFMRREYSLYPVTCWPVFFYGFLLPYLPSRANNLPDNKIPIARQVMSAIVILLFFATCYSLMLSVIPDPGRLLYSPISIAAILFSLALFFFVRKSMLCGITFGSETFGKGIFSQENKLWTWSMRGLIFLPAIFHITLSLIFGESKLALASLSFVILVLISIYLRYAFRTVGGTVKAGAFAFAAFLVVVMFL